MPVKEPFMPPAPEPERLSNENKERWAKMGRESLESLEIPESLKEEMRRSLDTPQFGPYHNEGLRMDSHLGLMMENVDQIHAGTFDFAELGLSEEEQPEAEKLVKSAIDANYDDMRSYAYVHDLKKPDCMNWEFEGKRQEFKTMDDWGAIVKGAKGDEEIQARLKEMGVKKIGYRLDKTLTGDEDKEHGEEGEKFVRQLAEKDPEVKEFIRDKGLILTGVANHEMHFKVFGQAKSPKRYKEEIADKFKPEEIGFIYAACLIDIASSLNEQGKADYKGFRNMVTAKLMYDEIQDFIKEREIQEEREGQGQGKKPLTVHQVSELLASADRQQFDKRLDKILNPPRTGLEEAEIALVEKELPKWRLKDAKLDDDTAATIKEALRDENYASALGKQGLGKYAGMIKTLLLSSKK